MNAQQLTSAANGWPGVLTNLTATAVIFYIVLTQMPATQARFHEQLEKERAAYREELTQLRATFETAVRDITQSFRELASRIDRVSVKTSAHEDP